MHKISIALGLALALAVMPACKKGDKKKADDKTAEPAPKDPAMDEKPATPETPPAEAEKPPAEGEGTATAPTMTNKMANCPSAAPGAATKVVTGKANVVVTISAKDKAQVAEIQKRAKKLSTLDASADTEVKHTGEGTGGGALGMCPVVMNDVKLAVKDVKTGSEITMTPKDAAKLAEIGKLAADRAAAMPAAE